jgi:glutamate transport system permease protein
MTSVLYDELGPRGRRRVRLASAIAFVALFVVVVLALRQLDRRGQLEASRWRTLGDPALLRFLANGLWLNVKAAVVAMALALTLGTLLALARLSRVRVVRWSAGAFVELFRGLPQLLLILGAALLLPKYGYQLPVFVYLVVGLTLYQGSVLAEVFRAGILSLDRGQSEAAYAVGLTYRQAMTYVVVPQAVRRMLPSIVSQLVTLFKDTSLGYVIGYFELLRRGKVATAQFSNSLLQIYLLVALVFIAVNLLLSRAARRLERRQQRRYGGTAAPGVTGVEDLAVLDPQAGR